MAIKNITVKFPLVVGDAGGYETIDIDNVAESVKFNLKNILLTNPGEKISDISFGVGLMGYLFSNNQSSMKPLRANIENQIKKYYDVFDRLQIDIRMFDRDENTLKVTLRYEIDQIKLSDELEVEVSL
jgi:phage baseplate assembly protein W